MRSCHALKGFLNFIIYNCAVINIKAVSTLVGEKSYDNSMNGTMEMNKFI